MNWQQLDKFSNVNYHSTNESYVGFPKQDMTSVTPAPFNPFPAVGFHPNYSEILPKNEHFEKLNYQRKQDEDFISRYFFGKKFKKLPTHKKSPMKINEARTVLLEVISRKRQLKEMLNKINVSDDNFQVKLDLMKELQKDICDCLLKFDPITVKLLQDKLKLRLKKRVNIRNRKKNFKKLKKRKLEEVAKKSEIIDKILNEKAEEVNAVKREDNLKRQADSVLHEVRRKNFDAKKILNTLNALSKLRELRSQQEIARGGYASQSLTDTFNTVITYFQGKWKGQLDLYQLEEKGLKVMLEENSLPEIKWTKSKYETIFYQWEQALFGDDAGENDLSGRVYKDMDYLIDIRRQWDKYLVNSPTLMSSNIPIGWVVPVKTEDEEWNKFLKKRKNVK